MYRYDSIDHDIVQTRVEEFRDQVARRLSGALTEEEFRPLRLMNGLYLQLHGYMLRVAVPYGTLSSDQLRALADIADRYDRGYGHFTTRQNIQFNWPKLDEVPDLLADLAKVEMHAIQTSGNCIRNITTDPFAGAAAEEVEDPRITGEVMRQWSTFHPEFAFLPRKFKIAITGSAKDRAAIAVHDIGIRVVRRNGEVGYEIWVGGGQGRTPMLASRIRPYLPRLHLLSYLEAILRVYNRHGRRDNKYKARIKILVGAMGARAFTEEVEEEWQAILGESEPVDVPKEEWDRVAAFFDLQLPPAEDTLQEEPPAAFRHWVDVNVQAHARAVYANPVVSLKPVGGIPGDATSSQMRSVAALADRFGQREVRVTHEQNLVIPHVRRSDLLSLWRALVNEGLATANRDLITDIISCPGMDYCTLANTRSIPIAQDIAKRFADAGRERKIGKLSIKISGCINACGHHHVGNIGILGIDKRGEEAFQIAIGGDPGEDAALAKIVGRAVSREEVPDAIEAIVETYLELKEGDESFIETFRRVGLEPFKERVYGPVHA